MSWVWLLVAAVFFIGLGAGFALMRGKPRNPRRLSLISRICASGPFPGASAVPNYPIQAALYVSALPDEQRLRELLQAKLSDLRFWSSPSADASEWVPNGIPVEGHIVRASVPSSSAFDRYVERMLTVEPPSMWDVHLVSSARADERNAMVLVRFSHVIGDGVSLTLALLGLFSNRDGSPYSMPEFTRRAAAPPPRAAPLARALAAGLAALSFLRLLCRSIAKALLLPVLPGDRNNPLLPDSGLFRTPSRLRLLRAPLVPLATVKRIKDRIPGATVNDVITAALADAVARYSAELGVVLRDGAVRAMVPFAFPRRTTRPTNQWCFLSLGLPVETGSPPLARLAAANRTLDELKRSPEALVQFYIQMAAFAVLPVGVRRQTTQDTFAKHSMVFTNVPGPTERVWLCGAEVQAVAPCIGNIRSQVTVVSYAGSVVATFVLDPDVVAQPELFVAKFGEAVAALDAASGSGSE